jgi:hypothetical protein
MPVLRAALPRGVTAQGFIETRFLASRSCDRGYVTLIGGLCLCWWDASDRLQQSPVVPPVDHSSVAISTSSRPLHGPLLRTSSVL